MGINTITQLTDDLDGEVIEQGAGRSVRFSVEGRTYELELRDENIAKLEAALAPFVEAAREVDKYPPAPSAVRRRSGGSQTRRDPSQTKAIKDWAKANGFEVPARGRIPNAVLDAYEAAH